MLRDWGPRHQQDGLKPVEVLQVPLWSKEQALAYVQEQVKLHRGAMEEEVLPICTPEERWATPTTYAMTKQARKKTQGVQSLSWTTYAFV